jgi:tetratricopeptide (TPR) repeat protein
MAIEPRLKQLLESWEDLRDAGQTPTPEDHCRDCPELLEAFRRLLRRFEQLEEMSDPAGEGRGAARGTGDGATSRAVRFRMDGEPLRGGMGEVFPARDEELGRTVALKFIQRGKGGLAVERRFRREVAITARLQHPGIVPVYSPTVSDDGRSGYAMRFIAGESLDAAIARHHDGGAAEKPKPTRAELLDRFEAVCNTMAYAHSHGVIHRDLKPANVMLGKYSQTFVVDWGLAKILVGDPDPTEEAQAEELTAMTAPGEDSTGEAFTATGVAFGTYAYMPPEQARGDYATLDERADVFALGAMLCKILTAQPAYVGKRVKQMAADADLAACFARLDACGADEELIALAKNCLEQSVTGRPKNAQEVLDAVRYRKAAIEARAREDRERRVAAEAKSAEERRRRRVTVALGVSVVAVLVVGGCGLWAWQEQRTLLQARNEFQAEQNRENAEASLAELDKLYQRFMWTDAKNLLDRTETLVAPEGDADLRERIAEAKRNTAFIKRLDEIRLEKSVIVEGKMNYAGALPKYRAAFEENGFDVLNGDRAELAAKLNSSAIRMYLLAALDDWAMTEKGANRKAIMTVTAMATGQSWRTQLSDAWDDGDRLAELYGGVPANERTPAIIAAVGPRLDELEKDGIRRVEEGLRQYPGDFWLHFNLGTMCRKERADARIGAYRAALAIRPSTPAVFVNLGSVFYELKEYDAAIAEYKAAILLAPKFAPLHNNLGNVFYRKKEYDAAIAAYKEAIRLDPIDAAPHNGLGLVFHDKKEYDAAIAEYKEAVRLYPKYAQPHYNLGNVFADTKEYDAAIAEYKEAIRLDAKDALPHNGLGNVFRYKKEYDAAIAEYKEAIRLDPKYAQPHNGLGIVFSAKKEYDAAIAEYKEAIRLDPKYALPHNNLGNVFSTKKDYDDAIAQYMKAICLDPNNAVPHYGLGNVYSAKKEYDAAIAEYKQAIRLDPNDAAPRNGLGLVLHDKMEYNAAIAEYKQAIRLDPKLAGPHHNLGNVFWAKKEYNEAIAEYKKAIDLDPKDALPHNGLGNVFYDKKEYGDAIVAFAEAIRLDPKNALAHHNLGNAFRAKKEYNEAIAEYKKAIDLDPKDALPHHGLGNVFYDKKEYGDAIVAFAEAIRLDPKFANPHNGLGNVLREKKKVNAAIAQYKKAIDLDPKYASPHYELGRIFYVQKKYDEAIAAFKKTILLDPKFAPSHNELGIVLRRKKDYGTAIAEYQKAIDLNPNYAFAYANLGNVYRDLGRFTESVEALRKAAKLEPKHAGILKDLLVSEQDLALDQRLPAIRGGTEKPKTPIEALRFARLAQQGFKKEYALAFRLFTDAFAADPKLIEANRYDAACAAIQFAAGNDVRVKLGTEEWYYLQHQARTWLAADLDALRNLAASDKPAERQKARTTLTHWLEDSDLVPVRDPAWLQAMPDDERKAWQALWADVQDVLQNLKATKQ